jgi:RNA polymerase sigma-70 factor (ECF subfamily)
VLGVFLDPGYGVLPQISVSIICRPRRSGELDEERDAYASQRPEAIQQDREQSEQIRRVLACLPAHYRVVIELRHYQEMSYEEIAAALNVPLSDVKSHLFRARKLLAEKLHAPD